MSQVKIRKGESVDDALRRFNRKVALNGNLAEARKGNIMKDLALGEEKNAKRLLKDKEKILVVFEETVMIIKNTLKH